ncbi:DEAD/DEAH box helicase family protein [Thomasclavelia sp.]|uniref:type I restriction endonuclease subunit R n=1 Tax=Thomasclavelia sp. TaxID=3025757 RepID=UPI0026212F0E|nr:DEAD/DEAH box helicase family protein [Thomasclavelia sp.]
MPIRADQLKEVKDYQRLIINYLCDVNGFVERPSSLYSAGLAMDTDLLFKFLEDTQHDSMESLRRMYQDRTEETIIALINSEVNRMNGKLISRGLIDVLKNGIEFDNGVKLHLMYRKPDSTRNTDAVDKYNKNIFSVMEEVYHKVNERIDLVIFLNGIAIFTIELKCNTSGQNYKDAIEQYKKERDYNTRLLKEKVGVFAAFAMDLNEVYFCTKLQGMNSHFNPYNMGNDFGKGNPHNPEGINVSYMWEDIWTKERIILLIDRFIYIKTKEKRNADTGRRTKTKELIFPRFHQLRAVERVMDSVIEHHSDRNYLIEHSAGSGKTETISWLAHILATVHDKDNLNIFDSVLVITDRIVVDRQLQEAIQGIDHKSGQVRVMDDRCNSDDLATTLHGNTKIIVTTIHKFYYILNSSILGNLKEKRFAILIDEAHSSTEGTYMQSVTHVLSNEEHDDELTEEDKMLEEIRRSGKQENVSMIAFTATPKPDTIQLFGTLNEQGNKESFDVYSMKQAIEEGYILNVLNNYVTWKTYCHINKAIESNPELKTVAAKRKMARFIDLHETNITQKVEIIVEHFRQNVMHLLDGNAKAMVITSSREAAVSYRKAMDNYIHQHGYTGIKALVAFSGKVPLNDEEYTEEKMNGIKEEELRYEFDRSCYQVLIVADKYQTGFDQPKLVAMYVDKKLRGTAAVQTLSRLNRICPPYDKTTFVLDFKNEYDDIKKAFEPYYKDTILFETVSPADIKDLDRDIDMYNIIFLDEVEDFNSYLYKDKRTDKDKQRMWSLLDSALMRIKSRDEKEQREIKITLRRFLKGYCFLIQATAYENLDLHKRYNYISYLIKEIDVGTGGNNFDIADKITVTDFKQKQIATHSGEQIEAKPEVAIKKPKPVSIEDDEKKLLSEIIDEVNALYDKHYEPDSTTKTAQQIKDLLLNIPDFKLRLEKSAKVNSLDDFKFTYNDCVQDALVAGFDQNVDFFTLLLENQTVRNKFANVFMLDIYNTLRNEEHGYLYNSNVISTNQSYLLAEDSAPYKTNLNKTKNGDSE